MSVSANSWFWWSSHRQGETGWLGIKLPGRSCSQRVDWCHVAWAVWSHQTMQTVRQTPPCRDIAPGIARQDHPGLHQHPRSQRVCLPDQAPSAPGACSGPHCWLLECSGVLLSIPLNLLHCTFTLLCRIPHQQNLPNYTARSIFVSAIKSLPLSQHLRSFWRID